MKGENELQHNRTTDGETNENERLGEQSNSTSLPDQNEAESKSIVEDKSSIDEQPSVEKDIEQDALSSTSNKENLPKRGKNPIDERRNASTFDFEQKSKKIKLRSFTKN